MGYISFSTIESWLLLVYRFKLYEYLQKTYDIGICLEFFKIFNSESIILHTQTVPQELLFDKMEILLNYSKQIG